MVSLPQETPTPARPMVSTNAPRCSHGAPVNVDVGHGTGHDERAGLDAVGDDPVLRAAQPLLALDLDGVWVRPLDLGAHLLQARDQIVDLGLLGGGPQDRVAVGQGGREPAPATPPIRRRCRPTTVDDPACAIAPAGDHSADAVGDHRTGLRPFRRAAGRSRPHQAARRRAAGRAHHRAGPGARRGRPRRCPTR